MPKLKQCPFFAYPAVYQDFKICATSCHELPKRVTILLVGFSVEFNELPLVTMPLLKIIYILRCVTGMTRSLLSSRCFPSQHCKQHKSESFSLSRKRTFPAFAPKPEVDTNGFIFFFCNIWAGVHPFLSNV